MFDAAKIIIILETAKKKAQKNSKQDEVLRQEMRIKTQCLFVKTRCLLRKTHRVLRKRNRLLKIPGLGIFIFVFVS